MDLRAKEVIERLKEIQLERVRLIQEERRLVELLERTVDIQGRAGHSSNRQATDLAQLRALEDISLQGSDISYGTGDKVYIKNKLGALSPIGRRPNIKDRAATIVATEEDRIYLKNFNGKESWRIAKNLRPLTVEEQNRLG